MAFLREKKEVALATRLKSLSEILMRDVKKYYDSKNVEFEPRWFSIIYILRERGEMSVTEIAKELLQTHPAVNQTANILEKKGLVESIKDGQDERRRLLRLTSKGKQRIKILQPLWQDIFTANADVLAHSAPLFLKELGRFEQALTEKSMFSRIVDEEKNQKPAILLKSYLPRLKDHFYMLNKQWLEEFFEMEDADHDVLTQPEKLLKEKAAEIWFAETEGVIAGTFCLIPLSKNIIEFSKFAVDAQYRKRGIGAFLLNSAIRRASELHARKLVLYTSPILISALNLYTRSGFVFKENDRADFYKRATVKMELDIA